METATEGWCWGEKSFASIRKCMMILFFAQLLQARTGWQLETGKESAKCGIPDSNLSMN